MTEAVLLNSGGIDSCVVAHIMHEKGWKLHSLHVPWNSLNRDESLRAAGLTAHRYCVSHEVANEPSDWVLGPDGVDPAGLTHTESFMAIQAVTYAHHIGVKWVVTGMHQDTVTEGWRDKFTDLLATAKMRRPPVLVMPLYDSESWLIGADTAKELGIDVSHTHSCHKGPACGECLKCNFRREYGIDA